MSKNNNYDVRCPHCGKYVSHECNARFRTVYGLDNGCMVVMYRCGDCKKYLPLRMFPSDSTKKWGIRNNCRRCRSKRGNGN